jgi:hypothetical protein
MESTSRYKRRRVLIQPRLQLRIVLAFLSAACISTLVQVLLLSHSLSALAESLPTEGNVVLEELPRILRNQVLLSFMLMAPLMLAVGVLETFRVVGPLYRIERYLRDVAAGTKPQPCKIRKGDELQELCRVVNQATQPFITGTHPTPAAAGSTTTAGAGHAAEPPSLVREAAPSEAAHQGPAK